MMFTVLDTFFGIFTGSEAHFRYFHEVCRHIFGNFTGLEVCFGTCHEIFIHSLRKKLPGI